MPDNINNESLDLHPDESMDTMDSDQDCTLLIEESNIQEQIDHHHGIFQSESDLLTVSQPIYNVNCPPRDEIPVSSWNVYNDQEKESDQEAEALESQSQDQHSHSLPPA